MVPACKACNASWQDDEIQFRNLLPACGGTSLTVNELWNGPARRSFDHVDGLRRAQDVYAQMVAVPTPNGQLYKVYPERDPRAMRVVR